MQYVFISSVIWLHYFPLSISTCILRVHTYSSTLDTYMPAVFIRECYLIFPANDTKRKVIRSFDYHRNLCPLVYCILESDRINFNNSLVAVCLQFKTYILNIEDCYTIYTYYCNCIADDVFVFINLGGL